MMRLVLAAVIALAALPAAAQQPTPPATVETRIATQLGNLIIQVTNQSIQIENLQAALAAAQQQVKDLQAKQDTPK